MTPCQTTSDRGALALGHGAKPGAVLAAVRHDTDNEKSGNVPDEARTA
jgi:hypothetical protein